MSKEELQKIIEAIEKSSSMEKSSFGIFQYGGGSDESYIKANKEGLVHFAVELLKAAKDYENLAPNKERTIFPLDYEASWIDQDSDTLIQYIEPKSNERSEAVQGKRKQTISDKLIPAAFLIAILILAISSIVGIVHIFKWLF